uniref:Ig-like domain-containing protein n=1 Tax=Zosterops lateralis melanops TaxID=1220523 RepID=A0A8D2NXD9_ZOSLA
CSFRARWLRSPCTGLWAQLRLQEAGGGLRAPGDSVTLSCHGSGFIFSSGGIWWYRQAPGDSLEWVSVIGSDPTVFYFDQSVQGRARISRDNSQFKAYLSLLTLHPRDSARYFCAVHTGQETQLSFSTNQLGSGSAATKYGDGELQSGSGLFLRNHGPFPVYHK